MFEKLIKNKYFQGALVGLALIVATETADAKNQKHFHNKSTPKTCAPEEYQLVKHIKQKQKELGVYENTIAFVTKDFYFRIGYEDRGAGKKNNKPNGIIDHYDRLYIFKDTIGQLDESVRRRLPDADPKNKYKTTCDLAEWYEDYNLDGHGSKGSIFGFNEPILKCGQPPDEQSKKLMKLVTEVNNTLNKGDYRPAKNLVYEASCN
jgi:hypothetical protein